MLLVISSDIKLDLWLKIILKKEGVNYHKTFSPVSKKDSFRIIMAFVALFDLKLHQMNMKTTLLNRDLDEEVYMN
jgi:hypothetical protein